ncbi:MAG: MBL fold metallo-hydrolase [candidate division Zixibacteria bacterium]|nr:MBL fold metallo-hydrolase [candidate division Zixibacteria bacterium]
MLIETVVVGPFEVNCYIVHDAGTKAGVIIDPGGDEPNILERIIEREISPKAILLTHGHGDHIAAVSGLKNRFHIPLYIGKEDKEMLASPAANISEIFGYEIICPPPDYLIEDNDIINVGGFRFTVFGTPGHTPGGVCYYIGKFLFCGDTLFYGSIGRADLPGSNYQQLIDSIKKNILTLPDDVICYPGHGPLTTVGTERRTNPFLTGI